MHRRIFAAVTAVAVVAVLVSPAVAEPKWKGVWAKRSYTNDAGTRDYWLYVPEKTARPDTPVVVYLHGCTQDGLDAAIGTRFNALAEEEGFIAVYPEQSTAANGSQCWNWFLPGDQARGGGEPSIIAGITESVATEFGASRDHIFVSGASAGGSMSATMGATYPDLFAAIAILAAPGHTGADPTGAAVNAAMGSNARPLPTIIFQGTTDTLVVYPLGRTALSQWLGANDLADDGERNSSVSQEPTIEHRSFDQEPQPGSGDPCVPKSWNYPCLGGAAGFQNEYPHTIETYAGAGYDDLVQFWSIHGLGHAYPAGDPAGTFTDPLGPDATRISYEYFMSHPMEGER